MRKGVQRFSKATETRIGIIAPDWVSRLILPALQVCSAPCRCVGSWAHADLSFGVMLREQPELLLVDAEDATDDQLEAVRWLKHCLPELRALFLHVHFDRARANWAIRAGADGFLNRPDEGTAWGEELCDWLERTSREHEAPPITQSKTPLSLPPGLVPLSPRELEVMQLLADGLRYKEIASSLGIKTSTVKAHLLHVYERWGVSSRTEAVMRFVGRTASRSGLSPHAPKPQPLPVASG